tara:strand:+ start:17305 stop:18189 length:885 start_codon:yes stop_codon:yes gene_type:complete
MIILLIGGSGQLGSQLLSLDISNKYKFLSPNSLELNITDKKKLNSYIDEKKPDVILNFSAYTDVNAAEKNLNNCIAINHLGVKNLVEVLSNFSIPFIHISTDYVFGKTGHGPYKVYDKRGSLNNYGYSKLLGEDEIINFSKKAIIIRTASLYGLFGNNFLKNYINILIKNNTIKAITDQKISLTWSFDLSLAILNIIKQIELEKIFNNEDNIKIIHLVNKGYTTWFEVACVISDFMNERANDKNYTSVRGIKSSEWPSPPRRPQDSRLLLDNIVNINMPFWRDSLNKAIKAYLK